MYKKIVKIVDLQSIQLDDTLDYGQFKNTISWHDTYLETLTNDGYRAELISFNGNNGQIISTQYTSMLWLMSLKIIYEKFINEEVNSAPDGVIIKLVDEDKSARDRTNQKWLIPVTNIFKCEACTELLGKDCSCSKNK